MRQDWSFETPTTILGLASAIVEHSLSKQGFRAGTMPDLRVAPRSGSSTVTQRSLALRSFIALKPPPAIRYPYYLRFPPPGGADIYPNSSVGVAREIRKWTAELSIYSSITWSELMRTASSSTTIDPQNASRRERWVVHSPTALIGSCCRSIR